MSSQAIHYADGRPSMRFIYPSTLADTDSDQHRHYLNRLCCAFRFSQPLDASFRPSPFSPCFVRVAPMSFRPTEVCPFQKRGTPHDAPFPSCCFPLHTLLRQAVEVSATPQLQGFAQSESPFRQTRCYPTSADRSSPGLIPLRGFHPSGLDPVLPRSLLSWAFTSR